MTKKLYVGLTIAFLLFLIYYFFPVNFSEKFKSKDKADFVKIEPYYLDSALNKKYTEDDVKTQKTIIEKVVRTLNKEKIIRIPFSMNIANDGKYISFYLVSEKDGGVYIELNDKGYVNILGKTFRYVNKNKDIVDELANEMGLE